MITIVRIVLGAVFFARGAQLALGWFGGTGLRRLFRTAMPTAAAAFSINAAEFADHPDYDFCAVIERMENLASVKTVRQRP